MREEYILKMENITKVFPGVKALDQVHLRVKKQTVHAVMGENGAGKSTLMKILLGIYQADSGSVWFNGKVQNFKGVQDALNHSLAMIHQELSNVKQLTVAQNIFLGKEPTHRGTGLVDTKTMMKETKQLMASLNIEIDPSAKMEDLSVSMQQLCEIAKAISYHAVLIVMDEPTSAITSSEVKQLFKIIKNLIERGITIIYITHKMDEVFKICDEISVYCDGKYVGTKAAKDITSDQLIEMMVGRTLTQMFPKEQVEIGEPLLKVEGFSKKGVFENINFELKRGEILGVAGLIGSGRSEVMETIFGFSARPQEKSIFVARSYRLIRQKKPLKISWRC